MDKITYSDIMLVYEASGRNVDYDKINNMVEKWLIETEGLSLKQCQLITGFAYDRWHSCYTDYLNGVLDMVLFTKKFLTSLYQD